VADRADGEGREIGGYLSGEVLEDGGEVDGCAGADTLRVLACLEVTRDTANGELEPGLGRPRHRLGCGLRLAAAAASGGTHRRFAWVVLEASEPFEVLGTGAMVARWEEKRAAPSNL
jgi:hypothetical protein